MRELIFRAWDPLRKQMCNVICLNCHRNEEHILQRMDPIPCVDNNCYNIDASDIIIEQFIGLRDSKRTKEWPKGQMVFEGDVATGTWQVDHRTIITGIVTYYPEFGLYALKNDEGNIASVIWDSCEVIGTIHTEAK